MIITGVLATAWILGSEATNDGDAPAEVSINQTDSSNSLIPEGESFTSGTRNDDTPSGESSSGRSNENKPPQNEDSSPQEKTQALWDNSSPDGTRIKVMSANFFHGIDGTRWRYRLRNTVDSFKEEEPDIIGTQEMRENQFNKLHEKPLVRQMYAFFPSKYQDGELISHNTILYNKHRLKIVDTREPKFRYNDPGKHTYGLVLFEDVNTGFRFWFGNKHDPAGPEDADKRYLNNKDDVRYYDNLTDAGTPAILTADFNSGDKVRSENNITYQNDPDNLAYCLFQKSGVFWNTFVAAKAHDNNEGFKKTCPPLDNANSVDAIYVSPTFKNDKGQETEVIVEDFFKVLNRGSQNANGSDVHDFPVATLLFPESFNPNNG